MERKRELALLALFRACRSMASGMAVLAFPYYVMGEMGYGALMLGLLYTTGALSAAFLGFLVGLLADLWGRKKTLFTIALLLPLSLFLVYASAGLPGLFLAAALGGFSATGSLMGGGVGGDVQPIVSAVLADLARSSRGRTAIFSGFLFLGGAAGSLGVLLARIFSARSAFLAAGFIALAGLLPLFPLVLPENKGRLGHLPNTKTIMKFSVTGALNGFSQGLVTPFLVPFFIIVYHLAKADMAVYGAASGVLASLALLGAPWLEGRWGFVRSIALTRGLGAALLVLLPLVRDLRLALLIYLVTPALRVAAVPVQQSALTQGVLPEERGRALGFNQVVRIGASAAAASFTGWMFGAARIALPFFAYGAVTATNLGLYWKFFGRRGESKK